MSPAFVERCGRAATSIPPDVGNALPVGRVGEASDIAEAYLYLMRERFSTGQVIAVDGVDPKVAGLVYVAACGPDTGEVVADLGKPYPPPPSFAAPIIDKQGFMSLSTDAVVKHFASDLPAAEARLAAATQGPINASAFGTKVSNVAWKTKPSWYIVARKDQAIAPDEERFFAKRIRAATTELDTSHVPMLSKPKDVAAVIMEAAAKAAH